MRDSGLNCRLRQDRYYIAVLSNVDHATERDGGSNEKVRGGAIDVPGVDWHILAKMASSLK